jgi:hypothetical protein
VRPAVVWTEYVLADRDLLTGDRWKCCFRRSHTTENVKEVIVGKVLHTPRSKEK